MPDFSKLTQRQREIYEFIREKIESRGYGPTVREIGEAFEIQSPSLPLNVAPGGGASVIEKLPVAEPNSGIMPR